jgi:hypothetical protein
MQMEEQRECDDNSEPALHIDFTVAELVVGLRKQRPGRACDYLGVRSELMRAFILHAEGQVEGQPFLVLWLRIINHIWRTGDTPQSWCRSLIYPIYKGKGADENTAGSWRPIAVYSRLLCILDGMVLARAMSFALRKRPDFGDAVWFHHREIDDICAGCYGVVE